MKIIILTIVGGLLIIVGSRTIAHVFLWLALYMFMAVPIFHLDMKYQLVTVILIGIAILAGKESEREKKIEVDRQIKELARKNKPKD